MKLRIKKICISFSLFLLIISLLVCSLLYLLNIFFPFPKEWLQEKRKNLVVLDANKKLLMRFPDVKGYWYFPIRYKKVHPSFKNAMISAEDKNFYSHSGVDYIAIFRALIGNVTGVRRYSGASTITMQCVRLLHPRPKRNLKNKCIEAFRAYQLEKILTKEQILEIYFNESPYGGNLIGVEAASQKYFGKQASELSIAESSLLAGLPQFPSAYRPDKYLKRALKRRKYVLRRLYEDRYIDAKQKKEIQKQIPTIVKRSRSFLAPHFCFYVKQKFPQLSKIHSTLDLEIQRLSEIAVSNGLSKFNSDEVTNAAVIVIENKTNAVRAMVGSCNYFSHTYQGKNNGTTAMRSPGSALKPFLYLLAFEKGMINPSSILRDIPFIHDEYRPKNYDLAFHGPITSRNALRYSLNIPAVRLQQKIGTKDFLFLLRKIGILSLKKSPGHYGLSLTLGSCEISLLELTHAYSTLAREGIYMPLKFLESDSLPEKRRVFSKAASYLIHDILQDHSQLRQSGIHIGKSIPKFCWKTGTSTGNKDAITIIYNPLYTIGVWVGNFDGRSSKKIVGIQAAAPIAYQIYEELMQNRKAKWYTRPSSVKKISLCSVSGDLPKPGLCSNLIQDFYIPNITSMYHCRIHKKVPVLGKYCLCSHCKHGKYKLKVFEKWDVETSIWLKQRGDRNLIPTHNPKCNRDKRSKIVILHPRNQAKYITENEEKAKLLLQAINERSSKMYWFQNGLFIKAVTSGQKYFHALKKGKHFLSCLDQHGNSAQVVVWVK